MGEQHLDLFAQPARGPALSGFSDLARHIACALVDGAWHLPRPSTRTALELEGASCAVVFAGAVEHRCIVIHQSARSGQLLQASKSSSKHEIADGSAAAQSERTPSVSARAHPHPQALGPSGACGVGVDYSGHYTVVIFFNWQFYPSRNWASAVLIPLYCLMYRPQL